MERKPTLSDNHYITLGIKPTATYDEIKNQFRSLAKQYHPDINDGAKAQEQFIHIQLAYKVLIDWQARRSYDYELRKLSNEIKRKERKTYRAPSQNHNSNTEYIQMDESTNFWLYNSIFMVGIVAGGIVFLTGLTILIVAQGAVKLGVLICIPSFLLARDGYNGLTFKKKPWLSTAWRKVKRTFQIQFG